MSGSESGYNKLLWASVGVVFATGVLTGLTLGWLIWA